MFFAPDSPPPWAERPALVIPNGLPRVARPAQRPQVRHLVAAASGLAHHVIDVSLTAHHDPATILTSPVVDRQPLLPRQPPRPTTVARRGLVAGRGVTPLLAVDPWRAESRDAVRHGSASFRRGRPNLLRLDAARLHPANQVAPQVERPASNVAAPGKFGAGSGRSPGAQCGGTDAEKLGRLVPGKNFTRRREVVVGGVHAATVAAATTARNQLRCTYNEELASRTAKVNVAVGQPCPKQLPVIFSKSKKRPYTTVNTRVQYPAASR